MRTTTFDLVGLAIDLALTGVGLGLSMACAFVIGRGFATADPISVGGLVVLASIVGLCLSMWLTLEGMKSVEARLRGR